MSLLARLSGLAGLLLLLGLPAGSAALTISEVLYDAQGADDGKVFVELFGAAGRGLEGFTLEGVNGADGAVRPVLHLSGSIPQDGFFVVADRGAGGGSTVPGADLLLDFDFQNGPDSLVLRAPGGSVLDSVGYGAFGPGEVFAGEGSPAPDAPAGRSIARLRPDLDSQDNAADFEIPAAPSPGWGPAALPEPAPVLLLLLAGSALLAARRSP